ATLGAVCWAWAKLIGRKAFALVKSFTEADRALLKKLAALVREQLGELYKEAGVEAKVPTDEALAERLVSALDQSGEHDKAALRPKFHVGDVVENVFAGSGNPTYIPGTVREVSPGTTPRPSSNPFKPGKPGTDTRYRVEWSNGRSGWASEDAL